MVEVGVDLAGGGAGGAGRRAGAPRRRACGPAGGPGPLSGGELAPLMIVAPGTATWQTGVQVRLPAGRGGARRLRPLSTPRSPSRGAGTHELVAGAGARRRWSPSPGGTRLASSRWACACRRGCHELRLAGTGWDATSVVIKRAQPGLLADAGAARTGASCCCCTPCGTRTGRGGHLRRPGGHRPGPAPAVTAAATLPLLACWLDGRPEPNPYAPASRLMWNELFVDVAAPNAPTRPRQGLLAYQTLAAAQHDALSRAAVPVSASPAVEQYARFRAVAARLGRRWRRWPTDLRRPPLGPGVGDPTTSCSTASPSGRPTANSARRRPPSPDGASGRCSTSHSAPILTRPTAGTCPACSATTSPSAPRRTPSSARPGLGRPRHRPRRAPGAPATPTSATAWPTRCATPASYASTGWGGRTTSGGSRPAPVPRKARPSATQPGAVRPGVPRIPAPPLHRGGEDRGVVPDAVRRPSPATACCACTRPSSRAPDRRPGAVAAVSTRPTCPRWPAGGRAPTSPTARPAACSIRPGRRRQGGAPPGLALAHRGGGVARRRRRRPTPPR